VTPPLSVEAWSGGKTTNGILLFTHITYYIYFLHSAKQTIKKEKMNYDKSYKSKRFFETGRKRA